MDKWIKIHLRHDKVHFGDLQNDFLMKKRRCMKVFHDVHRVRRDLGRTFEPSNNHFGEWLVVCKLPEFLVITYCMICMLFDDEIRVQRAHRIPMHSGELPLNSFHVTWWSIPIAFNDPQMQSLAAPKSLKLDISPSLGVSQVAYETPKNFLLPPWHPIPASQVLL